MTLKSWPNISSGTLNDVLGWIHEVTRTRSEDVGNFDLLPELYMRGRKVGKVPADADDVAVTDRPGDFNYDTDHYYIAVEDSGVLKWARFDISTANPWASGGSSGSGSDGILDGGLRLTGVGLLDGGLRV